MGPTQPTTPTTPAAAAPAQAPAAGAPMPATPATPAPVAAVPAATGVGQPAPAAAAAPGPDLQAAEAAFQNARAAVVASWIKERDLLYLVDQGLLAPGDEELVQTSAEAGVAAHALGAARMQLARARAQAGQ